MIEDDQEEAGAVAIYFEVVFTQEPPHDEELDPNTKSTDRLFTVDFDQDSVLKAPGT